MQKRRSFDRLFLFVIFMRHCFVTIICPKTIFEKKTGLS